MFGAIDQFVSKKSNIVYNWIDFMTMLDIPFSWANYAPASRFFTIPSMDPRTIKNYMVKVGDRIELTVCSS
jgi:hypothetical protein